jgi:hypothetical protein
MKTSNGLWRGASLYSCPEKFFPVIQMRCHCEERSSLPL